MKWLGKGGGVLEHNSRVKFGGGQQMADLVERGFHRVNGADDELQCALVWLSFAIHPDKTIGGEPLKCCFINGPHAACDFADSLRAALTVEELRQMLQESGLDGVSVAQITDRHWSAERL